MSLTIDCGEGRHAPVCRGAGTEHYLVPQYDDGTEFACACKCHERYKGNPDNLTGYGDHG